MNALKGCCGERTTLRSPGEKDTELGWHVVQRMLIVISGGGAITNESICVVRWAPGLVKTCKIWSGHHDFVLVVTMMQVITINASVVFQCDAAHGMKTFFRMLDEEPVKIILFGDACPAVTDPIAKAIKFFHLIQVSPRCF